MGCWPGPGMVPSRCRQRTLLPSSGRPASYGSKTDAHKESDSSGLLLSNYRGQVWPRTYHVLGTSLGEEPCRWILPSPLSQCLYSSVREIVQGEGCCGAAGQGAAKYGLGCCVPGAEPGSGAVVVIRGYMLGGCRRTELGWGFTAFMECSSKGGLPGEGDV